MKRLTLLGLGLLGIGLLLWAGYVALGGAYVDEDGVLREPFPLLALGWFFVLAGVVALAGSIGIAIIKRLRTPK
ncbi:DUF3955 domain-containing protein [Tropicimonas sp. TH_r6]|uniref:DUF3955 domain-containing protein n=1 Tax=Tropicimonas sp. TH_r6 TaxID=3082085 RepID=UPI00295447A2|nr:DUF3955 domain-containing protein [Tropicimonas sp. TH_r6]MDV7145961.1 DUF3955 domain-containing protein [Tropicimonas sp. TH_r6]